ncbi:beta-1,6-N-acetylglucosaminyltransferase [Weissella confusa]|uniref:beta-1,6-N-acetylglucosaminyltransferase n=1 Tax=Weissella confusa TaxID=1583 RepID=UPI0022E72424|nr:beta-1,6-N-acetylglucosaminyltransferase [Weissella confusa]
MDVKHVFMVEGSGDGKVLQHTLRHFYDDMFHFVIHWDLKSELPDFSTYKNVTLIPRQRVYWGTDSQVLVENQLFKAAKDRCGQAKWYHLISESDVPLMSPTYFDDFYNQKTVSDVEFDGHKDKYKSRIQYYMPIRHLKIRDSKVGLFMHRAVKAANMACKVDRLKKLGKPVYKGSNWVSLTATDLDKVLSFNGFHHFLTSSLADEVYVQTILGDSQLDQVNPNREVMDDRYLALSSRYVDWKRGNPYQFNEADVSELVGLKNSRYTFARKVKSEAVARAVVAELN